MPKTPTPPGRTRPTQHKLASEPSPKRGRSLLVVFFGLALVGGLLTKFNRKGPTPPVAALPTAPAKSPAKAKQLHRQLSAKTPVANAKTQQLALNLQSGFKSVENVVSDDGKTQLKITVQTMPVCHPGDFEAMGLLVGSDGEVLLSVEPFNGKGQSGRPTGTRKIALKDVAKGITFDVPVDGKSDAIYGIYLCADRSRSGSCGDKKPANFNAILNRLPSSRAEDPIFYFQFAAIKPAETMVYSGLNRGLPAAKETLGKQNVNGGDLDDDLEKVSSLMRGVQSFPPVTKAAGDNTAMVIRVAMLDTGRRCGGRRR